MYKPLKHFMTIALALAASMNAGYARDVAATKGGYNKKDNGTKKRSGGKSARKPYVWGTLGLSAVSEAIRKESGWIAPRKDRSIRYYGNGKRMEQR
jgi:hypothetical protein